MSKALWRPLAVVVAMSSVAIALWAVLTNVSPWPPAVFTNSSRGYRLTYPDGWNATLGFNDTLTLRSFATEGAPRDGNPPKGGALIAVQAFPPYTNPVFPEGSDDDSVLDKLIEAGGGTVTSRTTRASGEPARVAYTERLVNLNLVATVRHHDGKTFLVTLVYRTDDPNAAAHEHALDDVIASLSVTGAAPTP